MRRRCPWELLERSIPGARRHLRSLPVQGGAEVRSIPAARGIAEEQQQ